MRFKQANKDTNKRIIALLALFAIPLSGLSIDIYVPSLPAVSTYFNVDRSLVQLTITAYMAGLGLMQLFAGSISDSFGRKKPFLFSMIIYIIATFAIPHVTTIYQMLCLRVIQGVMVALIIVPLRAVIADLFSGKEFYKWINYMTLAWSIGPIVAPALGGYLQHYYGWQANFYFLSIYSIIAFVLICCFLPETSETRHPFRFKLILKRYAEILMHREYLIAVTTNGLLYSILIVFSVIGPFFIQNILHYTPIEFGHIALLMGLAWMLGSITSRLSLHVDQDKKAKLVLWGMLLVAIYMVISASMTTITIVNVVAPVVMLAWLAGINFPTNFARGIALFPKMTGSANALFGGISSIIAGGISALGAGLKASTLLPMSTAYLILIIICLVLAYCVRTQKTG